MNRAALIDYVQKGMGGETTRAAANRAITLVVDGIKVGLRKDRAVQLIGFGTFKVVERKPRVGVHPRTLDKLSIESSRTVKLAVGKELKSWL